MDFVIDTVGTTVSDTGPSTTQQKLTKSAELKKTLVDQIFASFPSATYGLNEPPVSSEPPATSTDPKQSKRAIKNRINNLLQESKGTDKKIKDLLKKSIVLDPDFEKLHSVPPYEVSNKRLKEERKKEREKTKGKKWYGLPAAEVTDEIKNDLEVLRMRSALDPKRFYKKNDLKVLPKYFQIGKVMDSPLDHYNNRLTRKQKKRTLVDELLADAEFNKYNKRKYREIIEEKQKTHYKAWRQAKKLKKRK